MSAAPANRAWRVLLKAVSYDRLRSGHSNDDVSDSLALFVTGRQELDRLVRFRISRVFDSRPGVIQVYLHGASCCFVIARLNCFKYPNMERD